ncbi:hypothetical protein [Xanthobacter sp. KR7-225]|uniref:hypothetical protein n=1 Tax=Xanthobacter sp. KR7-225 TaxID=3156613 RepID=UPI0032B4B157
MSTEPKSDREMLERIDRFKRQVPELAKHNVPWPHFAAAMELVTESNKRLADRIAALERAGNSESVKYSGVWQRKDAYARGAFVTHRGGLWHANTDTAGVEPGKTRDWTLAVKAGKNGKDAR